MKTDDPSDNLEYQIALSDDGSQLRITFFVDMTNELAEMSLVEGHRMSEETGVFKHLIDVTRVRSAQSLTDMYMQAYEKLSVSPFQLLSSLWPATLSRATTLLSAGKMLE